MCELAQDAEETKQSRHVRSSNRMPGGSAATKLIQIHTDTTYCCGLFDSYLQATALYALAQMSAG